ncbi:hypothetical protein B5E60_13025 [Alistipes sp. An116]|uniref:hypothetical protein n=1 Tax=Alistipes sp. An116 TaxID=1965546 RepID=UPI000B381162|nr:hypothetical protein [Alistipes sp. An116]OUQ50371.1 hypothetical protein B5E60_13025 [Alistipes sp. An116]
MDNNEVYALFEDIKNGLKGINDRLENAPKVSNSQSGEQAPVMDLAPIKDLFDSSAKEHQTQTKALLTKYAEAEVKTSNRILHLLRDLNESFVRSSEERKDEPQEYIHRHCFDIRSSKVFSLLVGMGVVCSLSIWGNIELWQSKRQYADDALKFRVIRSWGGCDANHILWMNDVFDIRRDEETIERLRQVADGYDKKLKSLSDSLMQEKLQVEQITNNKK